MIFTGRNSQSNDQTFAPKLIGGYTTPHLTQSDSYGVKVSALGEVYTLPGASTPASTSYTTIVSGGNVAMVDSSGSLRTRDRYVSTFDMYKYQVGIDAGSYTAPSGSASIILNGGNFAGYVREQFPSWVYEVVTDTFYQVSGWTAPTLSLSSSIALAGSAFVIKYNAPQNAYDSTLDVMQGVNLNPGYGQYQEEVVVDTTNITTESWYPGTNGYSMAGYSNMSLTGKMIDADGEMTLSVQVTNDDDATAANRDWITVYGSRNDTNTVVNSIPFTASTVTTNTYALLYDVFNWKYFRVYFSCSLAATGITGANPNPTGTNTAIVYMRRMF